MSTREEVITKAREHVAQNTYAGTDCSCVFLQEQDTYYRVGHILAAYDALAADLATATATLDALRAVIHWALGERDEFPERPERIEGKPYPFYWWRSELRKRATAAVAAASAATTTGVAQ